MFYLELLLWVFFLCYPIYIYLTTEKEKQQVLANPALRLKSYTATMTYLWLPTIVLLILAFSGHLSFAELGVEWQWDLNNQIGWGLTLIATIWGCLAIKQVAKDPDARASVKAQTNTYQWFLPTNKKEMQVMCWGICVTAGICEELLFRGYLLAFFNDYMPMYAAVILSSIMFGLPHIYQGFKGVLRTGAFGILFCLIYLATDSLVLPIVLHILGDIYSMKLTYTAMTTDTDNNCEKTNQEQIA